MKALSVLITMHNVSLYTEYMYEVKCSELCIMS